MVDSAVASTDVLTGAATHGPLTTSLRSRKYEYPLLPYEELFRNFASVEGPGYAPFYEELCAEIGEQPAVAGLLGAAPEGQRRHTLLLAALHAVVLRYPAEPLGRWYPSVPGRAPTIPLGEALARFVAEHEGEIRSIVAQRRTQTNEVARCAVLEPVVAWANADVHEPLLLIDLGASAGLNLLLDRWHYDYSDGTTRGALASEVEITSEVRGPTSIPSMPAPVIAGRIGIDLEPVDVTDPEATGWLEACIFPEQAERLERLRRALRVAASWPPEVVAGTVLEHLPGILDRAGEAPVCVFDTWLLPYLAEEERQTLAELIADRGLTHPISWICGEPARAIPGFHPPADAPGEATCWVVRRYRPGEETAESLVAYSHPHGAWLDWQA